MVESPPGPIKCALSGGHWSIEYSLNRDKGESTEWPRNREYSVDGVRGEVGQTLIKSRGRELKLYN